MYKTKQTLGAVLIAMAMSAQAQTPATELVNNNPIIHNERGISIDLYGDYTLVGTNLPKYGTPAQRGGLLFYQNQYIRPYYVSNTSDKAGGPKTVAIDQHALVISAPGFQSGDATLGKISIFNKTWNGTHYSPTASQSFTETVGETGFGEAVSISDNWIVVGAPNRNLEGGVKLYFRNPGNGVWEDKGWLALPNFDLAPFRFSEYGTKWSAAFGKSVHIHHNNLIVGAPGVGSFYIYEFNGTNWVKVSENKGTTRVGELVAISDEYAVATGGALETDVMKKSWGGTNPWPKLQTINTVYPVTIATEGNKLVLGMRAAPNGGQVDYYEVRSHAIPNTNTWVNDFVRIGKMNVSVAASPNGLFKVALLGASVAIYQNTVVAGANNAQYSPTGYADGAAFKANFSQYVAAREESGAEEVAATESHSNFFPNPASEAVNVSSASEIVSAHAFNTVGLKYTLPVVGNQVITSSLTAGMYVLTVSTKEGDITQNVMIK